MDDESKKAIAAMEEALAILLSGKQFEGFKLQTSAPQLQKLAGQINQLTQNFNEMSRLATDLAEGKLDGPLPCRHNYLAGPLKELHSQLRYLAWSFRQLHSGFIVNKLENTGELFEAFNGIVDQVAAASTQAAAKTSASVNSWRHHQILQTLNLLHIMVLEVDDAGCLVYANRSAKEKLGPLEKINPEHTQNNALKLIAKLNREETVFPACREIYEDKSKLWYRITSDRFKLPNGQAFFFNTVEDITEWKLKEHQLKLSATMDAMTGTYNRKEGLARLESTLLQPAPACSHCISFIDIDYLKTINDAYGHSEGDYAIQSIAKILLTSVRGTDIVCRYGGDEFLIIFEKCEEEEAKKIILRMYEKLKKINEQNPKPYALSFSYGIASFSNCSGTAYTVPGLLKLADKKMYQCKLKKNKEQQQLHKILYIYKNPRYEKSAKTP